ncbi:MAG: PAS domain S-box protein [Nannocystaceae bacterium]
MNPPLIATREVTVAAPSSAEGDLRARRLERLVELSSALMGPLEATAACEAAARSLADSPEIHFALVYPPSVEAARGNGARLAGVDGGQVDGAQVGRGQVDGGRVDGAQVGGTQVGRGQVGGGQVGGARVEGGQVDGAQVDGGSPDGAPIDDASTWPLAAVFEGATLLCEIGEPPRTAIATPLRVREDQPALGALVLGIAPGVRLDDDLHAFVARAAALIAGALRRCEEAAERRRLAEDEAAQRAEEAALDGIWVFGPDLRVLRMNQSARVLLRREGQIPERLVGRHLVDELLRDGYDAFRAQVLATIADRTPRAFDHRSAALGRWFLVRALPVADGGLVIRLRDVHEQREAEAAQRAIELRLATELRAMTDLHALTTLLARATDLEQALAEILEATLTVHETRMGVVQLQDARSRALWIAVSRGLPPSFLEVYARLGDDDSTACGRALRSGERAIIHDFAGDPASAELAEAATAAGIRAAETTPLVGRRGDVLGRMTVFFAAPRQPSARDLRMSDLHAREAAQLIERLRADEALRSSELRYRTFFENIHESVSIAEAVREEGEVVDWIFRDVNEAGLRVMGLRREQFVGRRASEVDVFPADAQAWLHRLYGAVLHSGEPVQYEGGLAGAYFVSTLFRMGEDLVASAAIDITDRKRAEERLRESELRLRAIADLVPDLLWSNDARGVTDWYNQRWCEYTGQSFDEACDFGWLAAIHPGDREASLDRFTRAIETGAPLRHEHRILGVDGEYRWFLVQARPLRDRHGAIQRWFGAATDIDEMRRAQEVLRRSHEDLEAQVRARTRALLETNAELRRSEERFARAFHASPIPTLLTAVQDGRILDINERGLLFFAGDRDALLGKTLPQLGAWSEVGGEAPESERAGAREARELRFHRRGGTTHHVLRTQEAVTLDGAACLIVMMIDITERKQAEGERAALLERIYTVQEDERRRIARELHDQLGQEITALILGLRRLGLAAAEGEPILEEIDGLQAIAHQLGHDAHTLALRLRPTALDDLGLCAALEHHVEQWGQAARIEVDFQTHGLEGQPRLPPAIETTIYRVVQESLTNVMRHAEARSVAVVVERRSDHVLTIVEDDGKGFDPEAAAQSRRLGLLGVRERAAQAGGTVHVESSPAAGTTVFLRLPLRDRAHDEPTKITRAPA